MLEWLPILSLQKHSAQNAFARRYTIQCILTLISVKMKRSNTAIEDEDSVEDCTLSF